MADTKISALAANSPAEVGNEIPVNDSGTSKKITLTDVKTLMQTLGMPRCTRLDSQHSVSSTTPTKVTELDQTLEIGTYTFGYWLIQRSATITVGPQYNFNFTGTADRARWWFEYADLSATLLAAIGTAAHNVTTSTLGFGMRQAEDTQATTAAGNMGPFATTNAVQTTATDILVMINGLIVVSASGNIELWHGSETATATTVEIGSSLVVVRTDL